MLYEMRGGDRMKGYLVGVVAVAALVSLASLFLKGKETERTAKIAFGLILLCEMLLPLAELLPTVWEKLDGEISVPGTEEGAPLYEKTGERAFAEGITRAVSEKFGIPVEQIDVRLESFDFQAMRAEKIFLTLRGRGALSDPKRVERYITESGLGDCEVNFEIG